MAIEKYYPKGGGHDVRAKSNDETRISRSIGKHYEKKRSLAQKIGKTKDTPTVPHMGTPKGN